MQTLNIFKDYFPQPSSVCSVNRHSEDNTFAQALRVMNTLPAPSAGPAYIPELPVKP